MEQSSNSKASMESVQEERQIMDCMGAHVLHKGKEALECTE